MVPPEKLLVLAGYPPEKFLGKFGEPLPSDPQQTRLAVHK